MNLLGKILVFVALSLVYCAISFFFLLMFAMGDCPTGEHCWGSTSDR